MSVSARVCRGNYAASESLDEEQTGHEVNKVNKSGKPAAKKAEVLDSATSNTDIVVAPVKANSVQKTTTDEKEPLSAEEQKLLTECETDIDANLQGAFVLGHRLEQIRDKKLYRATHTTFAIYCNERWDFSKTHANRLIQAYLCEKHLKGVKDVEVYVPTKESQVRLIADLEPEQQVEVASEVKAVVGDKRASADDFETAREKLFPKPKPEAKAAKAENDEAEENAKPASPVLPVTFDTKLVSFTELHRLAADAYNTFSDPRKHKEVEKLLFKLKDELSQYMDWECANQSVRTEKEAA